MGSRPPKATAPAGLGQFLQQAAEASVGTLPTIFQGFQEFGPKFAEAELGIRNLLFPLIQKVRRGTAGLLESRLAQSAAGEIPEFLKRSFQAATREAQSIRGIAQSPISAVQEGLGLAGLAEGVAQFNIGAGTRFGATPAPSIAGTAASTALLQPPRIEFGAELERGLIEDRDKAALQNFQVKQARRRALARAIGTGIGLVAAPFTGGASLALVGSSGSPAPFDVGTFF